MSSQVRKKICNAAWKASKNIKSRPKRRTSIVGAGLKSSDGVNMNRMTSFIQFKARKELAMRDYGMKLADFESVKEHARSLFVHRNFSEADAHIMACNTIDMYSESIAMEKIADAAFKASKIINWDGDKRKWGNIADATFKSGTYKPSTYLANPPIVVWGPPKKWAEIIDKVSHQEYLLEAFEVHKSDIDRLVLYARLIYKIPPNHAQVMSREAIAIDALVSKASKTLNLHMKECEEETFAHQDEDETRYASWEDSLVVDEEAGFMNSRDEMSIFMDSGEARKERSRLLSRFSSSSSYLINWTRIMKFMEFKARKEYAMEIYGVKLGDFKSLKENAFKLFEINNADAAIMASKTMAMDSESIAIEKIADALFKSSKILNWSCGNKKYLWNWHGNLADSGFKSPKSLKNFCKNMDIEARKAYTMEAFGVNSVDIDYLKYYAMTTFDNFVSGNFNEQEAVIMACQTIAIDNILNATSKALKSNLELVEPKEVEENTCGDMLAVHKDDRPYDRLFSYSSLRL